MEFYNLEPGSYLVQGVYKTNSGHDKGVFTGRVDAPPVIVMRYHKVLLGVPICG